MDRWIILAIGLLAYVAISYIAIREFKAVLIGLIDFSVLLLILGGILLIAQYVFRVEQYQSWYGIVAVVLGVMLKAWLRPAYRLKDGFVYLDKPYRRSEYPKAEVRDDLVLLYNAKQAKRANPKEAVALNLKGPLKQRNRKLIASLYQTAPL